MEKTMKGRLKLDEKMHNQFLKKGYRQRNRKKHV